MLKNPYKNAYNWIKAELMDVTSQLIALQGIDIVMLDFTKYVYEFSVQGD